jgi:hypothetical protein
MSQNNPFMLSFIMLGVILLNVFMLSVMAPENIYVVFVQGARLMHLAKMDQLLNKRRIPIVVFLH